MIIRNGPPMRLALLLSAALLPLATSARAAEESAACMTTASS